MSGPGAPLSFPGIEQMEDTAARVRKIVAETLGVEAEKATDDAKILDDLGGDSLDTVELILALEEEFSVEITDDQMEAISTVGEIVTLIQRLAN
jgi:acyl carrier protein